MLIFTFILGSIHVSNAQSTRNEFKLNGLYAALGLVDVQYERLIRDRFGFGVSLNANLRWDEFLGSVVLFGRVYSSKSSEGLFLEIHHATHLDEYNNEKQIVNFIGPAVGYKYLMNNDFTIEVLAGVGFNYHDIPNKHLGTFFYPRLGVFIGKRF